MPLKMAIKTKQKTKNIKNQIKTFNKNIHTLVEDENPAITTVLTMMRPEGLCKEH